MIYSFYSFKGGVGRSMALANLAELLYQRGLRVLIVDFDLEAPGLERYFDVDPDRDIPAEVLGQRGVVDMLYAYKDLRALFDLSQPDAALIAQRQIDSPDKFPFPVEPLDHFIIDIYPGEDPNTPCLSLLPAGRRAGEEYQRYAERLRGFDWDDFYLNWHGELFFEWFRLETMISLGYDIVLIDSRTGVTEMSGVSTYQLADAVIFFVAANQQNLDGTMMIARSLAEPELIKEGRHGRTLSMVFVPSRIDDSEADKLDRFQAQFERLLVPYMPSTLEFEEGPFIDLKIPYVPLYAYEEKIAFREIVKDEAGVESAAPGGRVQFKASSSDLRKAYERLTVTLSRLAPETNPIANLFRAPERDMLRSISVEAPAVFDDSAILSQHASQFTGRGWVFQEVEAWLADPEAPRFFLLTGEPGSGKSAFASQLVRISQGEVAVPEALSRLGPDFLSGWHFCNSQDLRHIDPRVFLESFALQLARRYPTYAQALVEIGSDPKLRVVVEQRTGITEGEVVGIAIKSFDLRRASVDESLSRVVREPIDRMIAEGFESPLIFLVDAVDESLAFSGEGDIVSLLARADSLVPQVRFIVTSRQVPDALRQLQSIGARECSLSAGEWTMLGQQDVFTFARYRLSQDPDLAERIDPGLSVETLASVVQARSQGNFLFATQLLDSLKSSPDPITLKQLEAAPTTLAEIYLRGLRRLIPDPSSWASLFAPVLGTLAVAGEPLLEDQLARFTQLGRAQVRRALTVLSQFLDVDESLAASDRHYALFHRSFADYLLNADQAEEFWCEAEEHHKMIARAYLDRLPESLDGYGFRHLPNHLYALRLDGIYRQALFSLLSPSLLEIVQDRGLDYSAVFSLADRIMAAAGEDPLDLTQIARAALTAATLRTFTVQIPPTVVGALAYAGQVERALNHAWLLVDPEKRSAAFRWIGEAYISQGRLVEAHQNLLRAFSEAQDIDAETERIAALFALAQPLARTGEGERIINTFDLHPESEPELALQAYSRLALGSSLAGDLSRATELAHHALAAFDALPVGEPSLDALQALVGTLVRVGEAQQARRVVGQAPNAQARIVLEYVLALNQDPAGDMGDLLRRLTGQSMPSTTEADEDRSDLPLEKRDLEVRTFIWKKSTLTSKRKRAVLPKEGEEPVPVDEETIKRFLADPQQSWSETFLPTGKSKRLADLLSERFAGNLLIEGGEGQDNLFITSLEDGVVRWYAGSQADPLRMALLRAAQGKLEDAFEQVTELEHDPERLAALGEMALLLAQLGQVEQALAVVNLILAEVQQPPESEDTRSAVGVRMARALAERGASDHALAFALEIDEITTRSLALVGIALELVQSGALSMAVKAVQEIPIEEIRFDIASGVIQGACLLAGLREEPPSEVIPLLSELHTAVWELHSLDEDVYLLGRAAQAFALAGDQVSAYETVLRGDSTRIEGAYARSMAEGELAAALVLAGEQAQAFDLVDRVLNRMEAEGRSYALLHPLLRVNQALAVTGDLVGGLERLDRIESDYDRARILAGVARELLWVREFEAAFKIVNEISMAQMQYGAYIELAESAAHLGESEWALRYAWSAASLVEEAGSNPAAAAYVLALAGLDHVEDTIRQLLDEMNLSLVPDMVEEKLVEAIARILITRRITRPLASDDLEEAIRQLLREVNLKLIPDGAKEKLDEAIADTLVSSEIFQMLVNVTDEVTQLAARAIELSEEDHSDAAAMSLASGALALAGQWDLAARVLARALALSSTAGRESFYTGLAAGAPALAVIEGGKFLQPVYQAVMEIDTWWGAGSRERRSASR